MNTIKRVPKMKRQPAKVRGLLTDRDIEIIQAVEEYIALSTVLINALFFSGFGGDLTRCWRRLQFLFHNGYLKRIEEVVPISEGTKALSYRLDEKGADVIDVPWNAKKYILSDSTLRHHVAKNHVRIAIQKALSPTLQLFKWMDESDLKAYMQDDQPGFIPDQYCVIEYNGQLPCFFIEADRGTESLQKRWYPKILLYLHYYQSGHYEARFNSRDVRILIVTTTAQRAENMRKMTEKAGGKGRFYFTHFGVLDHELFTKPIWTRAGREGHFSLLSSAVTSTTGQ